MVPNNDDATDHPAAQDALHALVLNWAEATFNEPCERTVPMAATDAEEMIRSQLTEKTGTHFLDSGGAYGRHWERNQENPPWEGAKMDVGHGYVTQNVYHFMSQHFQRDRTCVALEVCLWALSDGTPRLGDMEELADLTVYSPREIADEWDVPIEIAEDAYSVLVGEREPSMTWNTYNQECGSLSQCLQGTTFGGPYAEYAMIQVHQGADVRGGYTAPRVYRNAHGAWMPMEFEFSCDRCDWVDYESCLYGSEELLFCENVSELRLREEMADAGLWIGPYQHAVEEALETAREENGKNRYDGAAFHLCRDGDIGFCHVH